MEFHEVETAQHCAIYCRARGENGPERLLQQRQNCEAYLAELDIPRRIVLAERYDDLDVSGGTLDRPALQRLLTDIEQGLIQVVLVADLTRLSDNLFRCFEFMETGLKHDVRFCSVDEEFDSANPAHQDLMIQISDSSRLERQLVAARIADKIVRFRQIRSSQRG